MKSIVRTFPRVGVRAFHSTPVARAGGGHVRSHLFIS